MDSVWMVAEVNSMAPMFVPMLLVKVDPEMESVGMVEE